MNNDEQPGKIRAYKPIFTFNEKKRPLPVTWDCIFELETPNAVILSRFITSIKNEWRKQGFVALEVNGAREQYMRTPREPNAWKTPRRKTWQTVENFTTDYEETAFSVNECPFYEETRQTRIEGLHLAI